MHEIAEFLRDNPPFDTLSEEELDEVAAACEIEFAEAGTMVLEQAVTDARRGLGGATRRRRAAGRRSGRGHAVGG